MLQIFWFSIQNICCGILFIMSWFFVLPTGNTGTWLLTTNIRVSFYSNMPSHILIWASLSQLKLHFNVDGREKALTGTQLLLIYYKCYWSTTNVIDLLDLSLIYWILIEEQAYEMRELTHWCIHEFKEEKNYPTDFSIIKSKSEAVSYGSSVQTPQCLGYCETLLVLANTTIPSAPNSWSERLRL